MYSSFYRYIYIIIGVFAFTTAQSQSKEILGYLPSYRFNKINSIELNKLSQMNISFANPTADTGIIVEDEDYDNIVDMAHDEDIIICISLAGGAVGNPQYQRWIDYTTTEALPVFVHHIMQYCRMHNLDGVDFDLEWNLIEDVGTHYEPFVVMLADSLWAEDMVIMGTFPGTYRFSAVTDLCLETFDQINLMSYDLTGPWDPNNEGPHAPYSFAVQSINYWKAQGVTAEKLLLGVPFYGYDFAGSSVSAFTYANMVNINTDYAYLDQVDHKYYNGITTIQNKTILAKEEANGIMIWELGQDHFSEYSLLNAIYNQMETDIEDLFPEEQKWVKAYPNPTAHQLHLKNTYMSFAEYTIRDVTGKTCAIGHIEANETAIIDLEQFPNGLYVVRLIFTSSGEKQDIKILKIII